MSRQKLPFPPSSITGELGDYLLQMWRMFNDTPNASYFSGTNPNTSGVTGLPGDLLVNVGSASTNTRMWIAGGTSLSTNSWFPVRIA